MRIADMMAAGAYIPRAYGAKKRLRVGTDLLAMSGTHIEPARQPAQARLHDSVSLSTDEKTLLGLAAMRGTQQNFSLKGLTMTVRPPAEGETGEKILVVKRDGEDDQVFSFSGDARLVTNAKGEMQLLSGEQALTNGVLKATSDNEILLRVNAAKVDTGSYSSTVVSLGTSAATYTSEGGKTLYSGMFTGSTINDKSEQASFFGLFDNAVINVAQKGDFNGAFNNSFIQGGRGGNTFNGSYAASEVRGDAGKDVFSGNFIGQSTVYGMAGDDVFDGIFHQVTLDAGAGNDLIGQEGTLTYSKKHNRYDIAPTINESTVIAGDGNDTLQGVIRKTTADLGEGDNTAQGLFTDSQITSGAGADVVNALYSKNTTFSLGAGDDNATLATAIGSTVDGGSGINQVRFGAANNESGWNMKTSTGGSVNMQNMLFTHGTAQDENTDLTYGAIAFGGFRGNTVQPNTVDGQTIVSVVVDNVVRVSSAALLGQAEQLQKNTHTAKQYDGPAVVQSKKRALRAYGVFS